MTVHARSRAPRPASWPRFVALDLRSLRPLARTVLITAVVLVLFAAISGRDPILIQTICALGVATVVPSTLFATDEQAGLELLYRLLPLRRRTRVVGRYATVLLVIAVSIAGGTAVAGLFTAVTHVPVAGLAVNTGVLLAVLLLSHAIDLPLFLALGYQRARLWTFALLFAAVGGFVFVATRVPMPTRGTTPSTSLVVGAGILLAAVCYVVSAAISCRWYRRREF